METITRSALKAKLDQGQDMTILEVLGAAEFKDFHLPNAQNVPLGDDFEDRVHQVASDKNQPVVVYCKNRDCKASEEAAQRLEADGYHKVMDYAAGKEDWRDAGLPLH